MAHQHHRHHRPSPSPTESSFGGEDNQDQLMLNARLADATDAEPSPVSTPDPAAASVTASKRGKDAVKRPSSFAEFNKKVASESTSAAAAEAAKTATEAIDDALKVGVEYHLKGLQTHIASILDHHDTNTAIVTLLFLSKSVQTMVDTAIASIRGHGRGGGGGGGGRGDSRGSTAPPLGPRWQPPPIARVTAAAAAAAAPAGGAAAPVAVNPLAPFFGDGSTARVVYGPPLFGTGPIGVLPNADEYRRSAATSATHFVYDPAVLKKTDTDTT